MSCFLRASHPIFWEDPRFCSQIALPFAGTLTQCLNLIQWAKIFFVLNETSLMGIENNINDPTYNRSYEKQMPRF